MLSSTYTLNPEDIKFDDKYVVFNPTHDEMEYTATRESIKKLGQLDPVLMLNGMCVDGRHRVRAAKELKLQVLATDIHKDTPEDQVIMLCNKNVMSGRDYDNTQKAIQALRLVNEYKLTNIVAAQMMKVDRKLVSYAATIKGYGRDDVLHQLLISKSNKIQLDNMERPSRSLELIAKFLKAGVEESVVVVNESERIHWKADAFIKTEHGKAWYYEQMRLIEVLGEQAYGPLIAELANIRYREERSAASTEGGSTDTPTQSGAHAV